jgi:hypothetical protein
MLLNTGDCQGIGGKFGFNFCGQWVWHWKDHIDRMFMDLYSTRTLLGEAGDDKYQELKSAGVSATSEA